MVILLQAGIAMTWIQIAPTWNHRKGSTKLWACAEGIVKTVNRGPKTHKTPRLHELFRKVRVNFCLLPCDASQEPNGNCSEKNLFRWTFLFWVAFFGWILLLWVMWSFGEAVVQAAAKTDGTNSWQIWMLVRGFFENQPDPATKRSQRRMQVLKLHLRPSKTHYFHCVFLSPGVAEKPAFFAGCFFCWLRFSQGRGSSLRAQRLKKINLDWKFQSRLKV